MEYRIVSTGEIFKTRRISDFHFALTRKSTVSDRFNVVKLYTTKAEAEKTLKKILKKPESYGYGRTEKSDFAIEAVVKVSEKPSKTVRQRLTEIARLMDGLKEEPYLRLSHEEIVMFDKLTESFQRFLK